jgi:hypothetical protein
VTAGRVQAAAEAFWTAAGSPPPFPRDLSLVLPLALPLGVVVLPALALARVEGWLARRGVPYRFPCQDRRLRGCLLAHAGSGLVFVDGADGADQRRFTLAHEVAHFLLDYLRPRRDAVATLGDGILDVLDGRRAPTWAERADAVLGACPVGVYVHLLGRDGGRDPRAAAIEERADRLACELLAPAEDVGRRCASADEDGLTRSLRDDFGLPDPHASEYADRLLRAWRPAPSFVDWLRP